MVPDTSILGKTSINSCKFPMSLLPNSASFNCLLALLLSSPPWKKRKKKQWQIHWIYCAIRWWKFIALFDDMRVCFTMQLREKDKLWLNLRNYHPFCPKFKNQCSSTLKIYLGKVDGLTNDLRFKGQLNSFWI